LLFKPTFLIKSQQYCDSHVDHVYARNMNIGLRSSGLDGSAEMHLLGRRWNRWIEEHRKVPAANKIPKGRGSLKFGRDSEGYNVVMRW